MNTALFEGGWEEWQMDSQNPYEVGIPKEYDEIYLEKIVF